MKLDQRGDIAIAEIVLYVPILLVSIALVLRYGAVRKAGWIFFAILSIVRIVGGVTHILWEQDPSSKILQTVYAIMESTGLSPLLMATMAFLRTVIQHTLEHHPLLGTRTFRILQFVGVASVLLPTIAGLALAKAKQQSDLDLAATLRHAGALLFVLFYAAIAAIAGLCWLRREQLLKYRRKLLLAVAASLPLLLVRTLYSVLGAFAPTPFAFDGDGRPVPVPAAADSPLARFSVTTGDWALYLAMGIVVEYAVVLVYISAGVWLPLEKDVADYQKAGMHMHMRTGSEEGLTHNAQPYDSSSYLHV